MVLLRYLIGLMQGMLKRAKVIVTKNVTIHSVYRIGEGSYTPHELYAKN
jgi:hypothetical protein